MLKPQTYITKVNDHFIQIKGDFNIKYLLKSIGLPDEVIQDLFNTYIAVPKPKPISITEEVIENGNTEESKEDTGD